MNKKNTATNIPTTMKIILASASPRRRLLLRQIGLTFEVVPTATDESIASGADPVETVTSLARQKADAVSRNFKDALVIGADTIVVREGEILGKPTDEADAIAMLRSLSGKTHQVYTGVALITPGRSPSHVFHERTDVTFGKLGDDEISAYVAGGSPLDKAGAYGIQDDLGALFVEKIAGDYYNVVGFPLYRFYREVNKHLPGIVTPFESAPNTQQL